MTLPLRLTRTRRISNGVQSQTVSGRSDRDLAVCLAEVRSPASRRSDVQEVEKTLKNPPVMTIEGPHGVGVEVPAGVRVSIAARGLGMA